MNKREVIREIQRRTKVPEKEVKDVLYALIKNIEKELGARKKVSLRDFGVFKLYFRKGYGSKLPNGNETKIQGHHVVKFIPGRVLKSKIDPSFPQVVKPKRRSIFGFLGRFGSKKKEKEKEPAIKKEVEVPVEKIQMQNEKIKVEHADIKPKAKETKEEKMTPGKEKEKEDKTSQEQTLEDRKAQKDKEKKEKSKSSKKEIKTLDLKTKKISKKILALLPEYIARLYKAVPIGRKGDTLIIAMQNPSDIQAVEFIKKKVGMDVEVVGASEEDIKTVLERYTGIEAEIQKALRGSEFIKKEAKKEKKPQEEKISEEAPTSKIVKSFLNKAARQGASDIHIEPKEFDVSVRFRIDGVLQNVTTLPKSIQDAVIAKVKILSKLKLDETRLPQDGRFKTKVENREIDLRVSTFPTVFGEKIVMRILDKSKGILTLEELGLRGKSFKLVEENIHKSHGMTLVTGPTGSGKTTTLYAIIDRLNNTGLNIITLEDPVEYQIAGVNQGQVNPKIGFSFASGLRSILRQDPDVVMLGEIRDFETAEMAVHAALTGHIVLSTLHTNDAAGALPRLIDMKVEPFLIVSALNTVIAQRLVRKICENCITEDKVSEAVLEEVKRDLESLPEEEKKKIDFENIKLYKGRGCEACNDSGYKGRLGIFEVLAMAPEIQEATLKKTGSRIIAKEARGIGMINLKQDGILKALDKLTTIEEVWRVTKE